MQAAGGKFWVKQEHSPFWTLKLDLLRSTPNIVGNPYVIRGDKQGEHLINLQKPWRRYRKKAGR